MSCESELPGRQHHTVGIPNHHQRSPSLGARAPSATAGRGVPDRRWRCARDADGRGDCRARRASANKYFFCSERSEYGIYRIAYTVRVIGYTDYPVSRRSRVSSVLMIRIKKVLTNLARTIGSADYRKAFFLHLKWLGLLSTVASLLLTCDSHTRSVVTHGDLRARPKWIEGADTERR